MIINSKYYNIDVFINGMNICQIIHVHCLDGDLN